MCSTCWRARISGPVSRLMLEALKVMHENFDRIEKEWKQVLRECVVQVEYC